MTTTVPSKNDWDKALVRFAAIEARLDAIEAPAPVIEPPQEDPPVVTPPVTDPPVVVATGSYMIAQRTGDLPKIIRTPTDLAAAKLVLPFAKPVNPIQYPEYARGSYQAVGLTQYMGSTGERQEIGLYTDAVGMWLCGGSPNNMLVQAEAHADVPVHFGKVDLNVTPWANCYWPGNVKPYFDTSGYAVAPEAAHYPSLTYVPYLATGDLWYLRELQAAATFALIAGPGEPAYRPLIDGGQPRGLAWTLRSLREAQLATQEAEKAGPLPDDLLPSSYWKQRLDIYRDTLTAKYLKSADPRIQAFRNMVIDFTAWVAPWEQDFLGAVLGWMVWSGAEDWRDIYEWSIQQALDRAASGQDAIGYHWMIKPDTDDYTDIIRANPAPGDPEKEPNYEAYYRANLKIAALNGVSSAQAAFEMADGLCRNDNPYIPWKWAV